MTNEQAESLRTIALRSLAYQEKYGVVDTCYPGWARDYVEGGRPIPRSWEVEFKKDLNDENWIYANMLKESIEYFGVKWEEK